MRWCGRHAKCIWFSVTAVAVVAAYIWGSRLGKSSAQCHFTGAEGNIEINNEIAGLEIENASMQHELDSCQRQKETNSCPKERTFGEETPYGELCTPYACFVLEEIPEELGLENVPLEEFPDALNKQAKSLKEDFLKYNTERAPLEREIHDNKKRDGEVAVVMNNLSALKSRKLSAENEIERVREESAKFQEWLNSCRRTTGLILPSCKPCECRSCQECDCSQSSKKEL
jgi:hypothetical protein